MKAIWNWLFKPKPEIQEVVPTVEPKKEPDLVVGEPILSFVALVKSNPKRFRAAEKFYMGLGLRHYLTDTLTGETFWYFLDYEWKYGTNLRHQVAVYKGSHSFVTQDEWKYITRELEVFRESLRARASKVKTLRKERSNRKERQRLVDVYCTK